MRSSLLLFAATARNTDNNGNEVHTFLHDLLDENNLQARDNRHINRRQVSGTDLVGCGNYAMNHGDTDAAFNNIIAQCGGGTSVGKGLNFYSVSGCVVAYFCNLSSSNVQCFGSEMRQAGTAITNTCGSYNAGWDHFNTVGRTGQYGYEDKCGPGSNFCGRGI